MIRTLSNIKLRLGESEAKLYALAEKTLRAKPKYFKIEKKSLDARDKNNICWVYTVAFSATAEQTDEPKVFSVTKQPERVVIVGAGPGGLCCAIRLIEHGILPVVVERGGTVDERVAITNRFFTVGSLDENTNIQFGEGGAGTFSDGKLFTQTNSPYNREVLKTFVKFGAPEEILYLNKPHIGSDRLQGVVKNMREYIRSRGGSVLFHTLFEDVTVADGKVVAVTLCNLKTGERTALPVSDLVLAIGHSARDTFEALLGKGVLMEQKEFAVGVRIEHLQDRIGYAQYGEAYKKLPAADYKLTSHASDRAAFTFCMCPGGTVIAAASEKGGVVTNGMSNYARNEVNANSALVVQVKKEDFSSSHPLAGVEYQRRLEQCAFAAGGGNYRAPVQKVGDFLKDKTSDRFGEVLPSYPAKTTFAPLAEVLPRNITAALKPAILDMDRKLKGFADPDAVMTGVETRTSSPVRILRNERYESVGVAGMYPCGEGCGYAGGITSAAADGLRIAESIAEKYR